jgi:hypothetical protein
MLSSTGCPFSLEYRLLEVEMTEFPLIVRISDSSELLPGGVTSPGFGFAGELNMVFKMLHLFFWVCDSGGSDAESSFSEPWFLYAVACPDEDGGTMRSKETKKLPGDG